MPKPFKTLDEQIEYLRISKAVVFDDPDEARRILLDSNYYNLVSCSKVKFVEGIHGDRHVYSSHSFKDWYTFFLEDCQVSEHLMSAMISLERTLNSRTAYRVAELLHLGILSAAQKNDLIQIFNSCRPRNSRLRTLKPFDGTEAWKYFVKMSFGDLKRILRWLYDNYPGVYENIVTDIPYLKRVVKPRLDELNNLRNNLFHFTPLSVYLSYGTGVVVQDNSHRIKAIQLLFTLRRDDGIYGLFKDIVTASNNYIRIKKRSTLKADRSKTPLELSPDPASSNPSGGLSIADTHVKREAS